MPKLIEEDRKKRLQVQVAFDKAMLAWIRRQAQAKDVSAAQIVRWAVREQMREATVAELQPA